MDDLAQHVWALGTVLNRASADLFGVPTHADVATQLQHEREQAVIDALLRCRNQGAWDEDLDVIAREMGMLDTWRDACKSR